MNGSDKPTITIGLDRKINLGNYESVGVSMFVSGIPAGTPEETTALVNELLASGKIAYDIMRVRLGEKVAEERQKGTNDERRRSS